MQWILATFCLMSNSFKTKYFYAIAKQVQNKAKCNNNLGNKNLTNILVSDIPMTTQ